jgi:hypothetical protein
MDEKIGVDSFNRAVKLFNQRFAKFSFQKWLKLHVERAKTEDDERFGLL